MRVALVSETFTPAVNGVVTSVLRAADHLALRGHEPVVVAPSGADYETRCGAVVPVHAVRSVRLPRYRELPLAAPTGEVGELLDELRPDVVHLASPAVLGSTAARAAQQRGIPAVAVFQTDLAAYAGRYRLPGGSATTWRWLRALHDRTALTLVPSTPTMAQLRRHGIGPLALWARGVDLEQFSPTRRSDAVRTALAPDGELLVGTVARLAVEKRLHLLGPLSELPGVRLVVVGDGPQRRALQRVLSRAVFTGRVVGEELGDLVSSLDLLVHPGADETFCQAVQEALAAGVPALVAASGGPLDLVRHGENGWLWAGDDPWVLAAQVEGLRDDRLALRAAAGRARASVAHRTWGRLGDELVGHYEQVLGGGTVHRLAS
ncbi:glycosyltransferase family 4 protein [Klenkia taihuensis]|uniref:Phosphatidylinositol alpha 1,6-mannosyltransferase n=1 Tax=Klenkia taihuensis TaxID=1225127 RepID=A0A1I1NXK2_9ACTN|nr:glycosyltransferase family 1 protein [Klenkia taihuensis]GHE11630.1 putative glycosyl transferase [Klenkia taihuensis]SFD02062.1 phosphatidylinositol alpha 1,6-mannosyltransferase [Klenkia taihuensis]